MKRILRVEFVRFCLVGGTGFAINLGLLTLFYKNMGLPIFISQVFASEISLFNNFILHHRWTYKHKSINKGLGKLVWQFHVTSWAAILGSSLFMSVAITILKINYVVALIASSVLALFWNFFTTKYIVWRQHNKSQEGESE